MFGAVLGGKPFPERSGGGWRAGAGFALVCLIPFVVVLVALYQGDRATWAARQQEAEQANLADLDLVERSIGGASLFGTALKRFELDLARHLRMVSGRPEATPPALVAGWAADLLRSDVGRVWRAFRGEIVLVRVASEAEGGRAVETLWRQGARLGLATLAETTVPYLLDPRGVSSATTAALQRAWRRRLGFPLVLTALREKAWGACAEFRQETAAWGFFWEALPLGPNAEGKIVLLGLTRLEKLSLRDRLRMATRLWEAPGRARPPLLFLLSGPGNRPCGSIGWRSEPALRGLLPHRLPAPGRSQVVGERWLVSAAAISEEGVACAVLARPLQPLHGRLGLALRLVAVFAWLGAILAGAADLALFGRWHRLPLWVSFGIAFLLAALLPLTGLFHLATRHVRETFQDDQKAARRHLHQEFQAVDDGQAEHSAAVSTMIHRGFLAPAFQTHLAQGERDWLERRDARRLGALLQGFLRRIRTPGHPLHRLPDGTMASLDKVLGFFLFGAERLAEFQNVERIPTPQEVKDFFRAAGQKSLQIRNPQLFAAGPPTSERSVDRHELIVEYGNHLMMNMLGYDAFLSFVYKPLSLIASRVGALRQTFYQVEIPLHGVVRFIGLLTWGENEQDQPYLRQVMARRQRTGAAPIQAVDRLNRTFLGAPPDLPDGVREAAYQAVETGLPVSAYDQAAGLLIEAMPCRNLNRHVLVGAAPLQPLLERMAAGHRRFWLLLGGFFLAALGLALAAATSFLLPIQAIIRAFRAVRAGEFTLRLDLPPGDEFGAVAAAFKALTRRLQEGRLLGRFVSEAVRQAARQGDLDRLAGDAREIEATVVFSGLGGFEERRHAAPVEELAAILEAHLAIASRAAARLGGEIDKLFGEKIMVVFEHARFDQPTVAAQAALAYARELREEFSRHPRLAGISPKIGINSGPVLLGFVGSPRVRLDHTVIGDTVNLASRLASLAHARPGGQILVAGPTLALAGETTHPRPLGIKQVRGKTRQVEVFQLSGF